MARKSSKKSKSDKEAEANRKIAEDAASAYVRGKGYTESSLEAVRRAAKANKRRSRVRVGNYEGDV